MVVGLALIVALPVTAHFVGGDWRSERPDAESVLLQAFPRGAVERVSCHGDGDVIARCSYSVDSQRCTATVDLRRTYGLPIVKC
jgi:hypothetical protein